MRVGRPPRRRTRQRSAASRTAGVGRERVLSWTEVSWAGIGREHRPFLLSAQGTQFSATQTHRHSLGHSQLWPQHHVIHRQAARTLDCFAPLNTLLNIRREMHSYCCLLFRSWFRRCRCGITITLLHPCANGQILEREKMIQLGREREAGVLPTGAPQTLQTHTQITACS